ncbi:MAG: type II secretion system protein J [Terriglobales bacterium]
MTMTRTTLVCGRDSSAPRRNGFSLLELIVAMAIFMLISGFALTLFRDQQIASQSLAGEVGLNLSLRDTVAQMQIDLANAGSGYFPGVNMPSWPVGVTLTNNVVQNGQSCYTAGTFTYGPTCFDQINIITAADSTTDPPTQATDSSGLPGGGNCSDTSTGVAYVQPASGLTLAQTAANYRTGDQLLFLNAKGTQITTVVLTHNGRVVLNAIRLRFDPTDVGAANPHGLNTVGDDPLNITTCDGNRPCSLCYDPADTASCSNPNKTSRTTNSFCGSDWVLKLAPIIYKVDSTNPADPVLTRKQKGVTDTVMEQVIGLKAGGTIWNSGASLFADQGQYVYDANIYCNLNCSSPPPAQGDMAYNFSLVRSVRISVIGRTVPDFSGTYKYRNGFDKGPYQVQGIAVVVNPRNMSMSD